MRLLVELLLEAGRRSGLGGDFTMSMTDTGARNLCVAIVRRAVDDYEGALYKYNTEKTKIKKR